MSQLEQNDSIYNTIVPYIQTNKKKSKGQWNGSAGKGICFSDLSFDLWDPYGRGRELMDPSWLPICTSVPHGTYASIDRQFTCTHNL